MLVRYLLFCILLRIVVKIYYELTFYRGEWKTQVGSTLASTGGSLTLAAGDTAHLTTADIFGQQGVTLTGQEVLVDGATNEAHEKRTHEESRSGLSLSLSNSAISVGETFRGAVRTAQSRDNKTLQGLELVDAGRNLRKDLKGKSPADVTSVGLHVGIGSSSFKQESEVNQQTYAGGRMMSAGDVTVRAESSQENKGNLTAVGESIQGKNVSLTASGTVRLQAGTNEETIRDSYQSHGASIGASFHGGLTSIDASYGKMKDQGTTTRVTHTGSQVTAQDSLMTSSGKDTTLVGSQLQGQSVTVKTGGNLHIESVQDSETYRGNRSSTGISVAYSPSVDVQENFLPQGTHATYFTYTGTGAKSGNASYSRGKTTSDYASVTELAGIYAGDQGYDVDVNKDTQLKGAVIASTADANRNHLTTGTLHLEDIQNKAAYDVKNTGVAYNHYASDQERNQHFNETGLTPDILPGAAKDAHSVTRSAISQGTIQVTQGVTDVTKINRDTAHALQTLDHIFDKQKVEERQELARLFAKNADELLHYYDRDGKFDKALAHGLVAEITSQLAGNKGGSGFAAGMTNELLINKIKEWAGNDPAKAQWISAALGATVNAAIGENISTGAAVAQYGMKWNELVQYTELTQNDRELDIQRAAEVLDQYKDELSEKAMDLADDMYTELSDDISGADYFSTTISVGKAFVAGSASVIVDRCHQVYVSVAYAPNVTFGAPLTSGLGYFDKPDYIDDLPKYYRETVTGLTVALQSIIGTGGTIGYSSSGFYEEVNVGGSVGVSGLIGYTWHVGTVGGN